MNKTGNELALIYAISAFLLFYLISYYLAHGLESQKTNTNITEESKVSSLSEAPLYTQLNFNKIAGEIFINSKYTGEIINVRTIAGTKDKAKIDIKETRGGWKTAVIPESGFGVDGLLITGLKGSLRVSLYKKKAATQVNEIQPLDELIISFGELDSTLLLPIKKVSEPDNFKIDILDYKTNKFISGDIVAITGNQMAVRFLDLPHTVVNQDGMIRLSVKKSNGSFIGADLKAWGYNISVPEIETGKSIPIKAKIFGLPKDTKLKFTFKPVSGQRITPSSGTLSVEKINSGASLATVVTSIPGAQPLNVVVEKVNEKQDIK
jgi:hypothetical protein